MQIEMEERERDQGLGSLFGSRKDAKTQKTTEHYADFRDGPNLGNLCNLWIAFPCACHQSNFFYPWLVYNRVMIPKRSSESLPRTGRSIWGQNRQASHRES